MKLLCLSVVSNALGFRSSGADEEEDLYGSICPEPHTDRGDNGPSKCPQVRIDVQSVATAISDDLITLVQKL